MSPTTDRQTFRETVALVAMADKAKLPLAVNGRIESAAKLVLWQDVEPQDDGSILVGSASDPGKTYRLEGTRCTCQDFQYGKAPDGWGAHRIAAGIHKRVHQLLAPAPEPPPPAGPLPEAPASVNVRVTMAGREVQWTLRDTDEARLAARLEALLACYPLPQPALEAARPPQGQPLGRGWCSKHGVQMKQTTKDGRSWWSHRTAAGQWCQGR